MAVFSSQMNRKLKPMKSMKKSRLMNWSLKRKMNVPSSRNVTTAALITAQRISR